MRFLVALIAVLLVLGCGTHQVGDLNTPFSRRSQPTNPTLEPSESAAPSGKAIDLAFAESDWPQFLGPTGNSVSPEKGILSAWPKEGLRVVWQLPVGSGYGMPSISKGRLYLFDRHENMARLRCMKRHSGEFLWEFTYPTQYRDYFGYNNGPRCCPIVDDELVFIYGSEGVLCCVQAADGKLVWKIDTRTDFGVVQNFFGVGSTPVVEGDLLIVQVGGSPPGSDPSDFASLKGNGSGVVALDKSTGKVRYKITDELASYSSPVLATIKGRRWCFVMARGGLIGFEPSTGKVDFQFPWRAESLESVNAANPVVVDDYVFITETYGPGSALLKVRPGGYNVVWTDADKRPRAKSMQCHWNTPIYHNGYLYGCSGRHPDNAELRCIEMATGKVMWSRPRLTRTSLLMVDGHFVCLAEDGTVLLLKVNPRCYEEVSRIESEVLLRYPAWAAPILSHGLLYVRDEQRLVCLELIPSKKSP
jgi:outer membrane protein assembly factor BamB